MTPREEVLYQQIHPLKLATDISAGYLSYLLLWQRWVGLGTAVLMQFLPAMLVSGALIRWADLERWLYSPSWRHSPRGPGAEVGHSPERRRR